MSDPGMWPLLLLAVPCLGALVSAVAWSTPREPKTLLLATSLACIMAVGLLAGVLGAAPPGLPLLCLLPFAAFASLLGQPLYLPHRTAWTLSVVILGLCLTSIALTGRLQWLALVVLFLVLLVTLARGRLPGTTQPTWGLATYGVGAVAAAVAATAAAPVSIAAGLLAACALIPLFPLHAGHVAGLMRLPGNLPALLVTALPAAGFAALLGVLPHLPEFAQTLLGGTALLSMLYGSVRALSQSRPLSALAHASLALYSILWWFVAVTGTLSSSGTVFLVAIGLVTGGLTLGWQAVHARFGDLDIRALGGLVHPMPRFAVLYSLLALAALGLPPFGLFSGFMGLLLSPDFYLPISSILVVLTWLTASWYHLDLMRRLLFGPPRPELRAEDVREPELAALTIILVLLVLLGTLPSRWFDSGRAARPALPVLETTQWHP